MMNDLKQRRMQLQYESYYSAYNKGFRQQFEKKETKERRGLVSWYEKPALETVSR